MTDTSSNSAPGRLLEVMAEIISSLDISIVIERSADAIKQLVEAEACSVLLLDHDTNELVFNVASGGLDETLREVRIPSSTGIAGWVVGNGESVICNDCEHDERFSSAVDHTYGFHTRSLLAVPIVRHDHKVGVMEAINKLGDAGFTAEDQALLETVARLIAIAIENAKLHGQIAEINRHLEDEVVLRSQELLDAKNRLEAVVDTIHDAILLVDRDLNVLWHNGVLRQWIGNLPAGGFRSSDIVIPQGEFDVERDPVLRAFDSGQVERTICESLIGEDSRYCEMTATPLWGGDGQVNQAVLIIHDQTEARELETKRIETARLASVTDTVAAVNHEVNSPLMGIIGNCELMLESIGNTSGPFATRLRTVLECARQIEEVAHRMAGIVTPVTKAYAGGVRILDIHHTQQDDVRFESGIHSDTGEGAP